MFIVKQQAIHVDKLTDIYDINVLYTFTTISIFYNSFLLDFIKLLRLKRIVILSKIKYLNIIACDINIQMKKLFI